MRDDIRWYFPGLCGVSETTMWHSRQSSATTFPHVSLFTKDDDSAKTLLVWCCFRRTCFWLFNSIAPSSFNRIYPGSKHIVGSGFWPILFVSAVLVLFHFRYQSTLIPVPPSLRWMWLQGLYPHTFFLCTKCWILPRHIHPMVNQGPHWKGWC